LLSILAPSLSPATTTDSAAVKTFARRRTVNCRTKRWRKKSGAARRLKGFTLPDVGKTQRRKQLQPIDNAGVGIPQCPIPPFLPIGILGFACGGIDFWGSFFDNYAPLISRRVCFDFCINS
jgi:hypothetical protein